jgi:hypothetical protein
VTSLGPRAAGEDIPLEPLAVAIAGAAGFTAGASGICAWRWARRRKGLATADRAASVEVLLA